MAVSVNQRFDNLRPCPFCGSHRVLPGGKNDPQVGEEGWFITCIDCRTYGPLCSTQGEAWQRWNYRVWSPPKDLIHG